MALRVVAGALLAACGDERVKTAPPELVIEETALAYGAVRVGREIEQPLLLRGLGRSSVTLSEVVVQDDPAAPGGAQAFSVVEPALIVPGEGVESLRVRFAPQGAGDFRAVLIILSDDEDPEDARKEIALSGRGAYPSVQVQPQCGAPCSGFATTLEPPSIDFGLRPVLRTDPLGRIINEPVWPTVAIQNDGEVPLVLSKVGFEGDASFGAKESLNAEGLVLEPGEKRTVRVTFDPRDPKPGYGGALVVASDDPERAEVRVALAGQLAPNAPPRVCAAIVEVQQPDGAVDVPKKFGDPVPVQPGDRGKVLLSAFSDHFQKDLHPHEITQGDQSLCTTDPEDGRMVLRYRWTVVERPAQSSAVVFGESNPESSFRPDAIGRYVLRLEVTDPQGATATADVQFDAIPQRDIAVQLSWDDAARDQHEVDLDLHLVKPGPCGVKADCVFDKAGDVNGFMSSKTGGVFDWGEPGKSYDNPRLEMDDQGYKLIESVTLNRPENDPACATQACTYDVYVHYFKDWRSSSPAAPSCPGKPCREGDECGCAGTSAGAGAVCVSDHCVQPVRPVVKVFIKPTPDHPEPVLTIPLGDENLTLAGPCFMWHAARITWPSLAQLAQDPDATVGVNEIGGPATRSFLYYGALSPRSFSCAPNTPAGTPEAEVTYLPGTAPLY